MRTDQVFTNPIIKACVQVIKNTACENEFGPRERDAATHCRLCSVAAGFRFRGPRYAGIVAAGEFLRNMKPAAAFSIGLWTGAAVIAAVGLFYVQNSDRARGSASSSADSRLAAETEQIRLLEQENARLNAEVQRLKETASTLKSNLAQRAVEEPHRRLPFVRRPAASENPSPEPGTDNWIAQAVAGADAGALPELERLAERNDRRALEAVALLADQDQAAALTRVWRSGSLTPLRLVDATRYLAATMEVNPDAGQLLRALAADPNADPRLLEAAVDGLANPNFPVSFLRDVAVSPPPHFKPDYTERMRMLEALRSSVTNEDVRAYIDQAKGELQTRWSESNPAAP